MDTKSIPPAGDPFHAAPHHGDQDERPHACTDGLVFLTYTVFEEAVGEEVERLEVVPCRRCASEASR